MKKYFLFLDESGTFESDEAAPAGKNPSMIGGFLWKEKNQREENKKLRSRICSLTSEDNHATEIDRTEKGKKVYNILSAAKEFNIIFVVFQNDRKKKIIDSTKTYLAVMTEGVIQLLKKLTILENDSIELEVVAGYKKDTTIPVTNSYVEGYIPRTDYEERLKEKLAIEKTKLMSNSINRSVVRFDLKDDKRDPFLVLCDYICNYWYTSPSKAFNGSIVLNKKTVPLRRALRELYDDDFIFPLFETEENEHVIRMVQDECFADVLFEACAGFLSESNAENAKRSFIKLRPKKIHSQLGNLCDYIGDVIRFNSSDKLIETLLNGAEELYRYLKEKEIKEDRFIFDIMLYKAAYLNSKGELQEAEQILSEIEPKLVKYAAQTLDIDYLLIFYTRQAVSLAEKHKYRKCIDLCDQMELMLLGVEEAIKSNGLLEGYEIRSEQLGKILGTKLQAQIALCILGKEEYENVVKVSERAISQFVYEFDLKRQFQYRAELEAACGHQSIAIGWLEKSFGGTNWKDYITGPRCSIFDLYNLLFVAAFTKYIDSKYSQDIVLHAYNTCQSMIKENGIIGALCRLFIGYTLYGDEKKGEQGRKMLEEIRNDAEDIDTYIKESLNTILSGKNGLEALYWEK